jgi:hypothetical protein
VRCDNDVAASTTSVTASGKKKKMEEEKKQKLKVTFLIFDYINYFELFSTFVFHSQLEPSLKKGFQHGKLKLFLEAAHFTFQ